VALLACISIAVFVPVQAQKCSDRDPQNAVEILQKLLRSCSSIDEFQAFESSHGYDAIFRSTSVAGEKAIPVLQQIARIPRKGACTYRAADARQALAKLGDEASKKLVRDEWEHATPYMGSNAGFMGDDWFLTALVEYLLEHVNDPAMHIQQGPADGPMDLRDNILTAIRAIARRHRVLDLPAADYSPAGIAEWKVWLDTHKGEKLSEPVYKHVADNIPSMSGPESGMGLSRCHPRHGDIWRKGCRADPQRISCTVRGKPDGSSNPFPGDTTTGGGRAGPRPGNSG
jgi:hypothetical protein